MPHVKTVLIVVSVVVASLLYLATRTSTHAPMPKYDAMVQALDATAKHKTTTEAKAQSIRAALATKPGAMYVTPRPPTEGPDEWAFPDYEHKGAVATRVADFALGPKAAELLAMDPVYGNLFDYKLRMFRDMEKCVGGNVGNLDFDLWWRELKPGEDGYEAGVTWMVGVECAETPAGTCLGVTRASSNMEDPGAVIDCVKAAHIGQLMKLPFRTNRGYFKHPATMRLPFRRDLMFKTLSE